MCRQPTLSIFRDFQYDFRVSAESNIPIPLCFSGYLVNPRSIWQVPLVASLRFERRIPRIKISCLTFWLRGYNGCVVLGVVHTIVTDQSCRLLLNDFTFSALSHHSVVCPIAPRTLTVTHYALTICAYAIGWTRWQESNSLFILGQMRENPK